MDSDVHEPVNMGNPVEMTILELAERIKEITGTSAPIEFHPLPEDEPKVRRPDIRRAKELLGWEPKVPLDEGLIHTIEDFRRRLGQGKESSP